MRNPTKLEFINEWFDYILKEVQRTFDVYKGYDTINELLVDLIIENQKAYYPGELTREIANTALNKEFAKREVLHGLLTAISLDMLASKGELPQPLQVIVEEDAWDYGVDEDLMFSTLNVSGSIGWTNAGLLDKTKPGIIGYVDKLGKTRKGITTTYLDDQLSALVVSSAARVAHKAPHSHAGNELEVQPASEGKDTREEDVPKNTLTDSIPEEETTPSEYNYTVHWVSGDEDNTFGTYDSLSGAMASIYEWWDKNNFIPKHVRIWKTLNTGNYTVDYGPHSMKYVIHVSSK